MDVNGTRFHALLGRADWAQCTPDGGIAVSDEATLKPLLLRLATAGSATPSDPAAQRRGAGRDRYGNWYWVDQSRTRVLVQSIGSGTVSDFWPAPDQQDQIGASRAGDFAPVGAEADPAPCRFGGLAVTEDHYLIVGTLDEPGLLVFDLHQGGPPRHLRWPAAIPFQPFDLAAAPGGGVWVLDRDNKRYWALDRHLGVIQPPGAPPPPDDFTPAAGGDDDLRPAAVGFPPGFDLAAAASPLAAVDPVAIEALPDGTVLILDRRSPVVLQRYRFADLLATVQLDISGVLAAPPASGEPLFGADIAFVPGADRAGDRAYVPSADGSQGFAFAITWQDAPLAISPAGGGVNDAPFLPMRLFSGRGLVAAGGYAWYDVEGRAWVPLVEQKRPRYLGEGTLQTPPFDGRDPGCVWHRLFIDGCLPPQTTVEVWSRTAEEQADLLRAPWAPEPPPRKRSSGPELPLLPAASGGSDARGVFELLFQRARGRFLQLKFRLRGDGRTSPRLRSLRIWYPRFSYLDRYLPAVYREDAESASFLDRFLANLEGLFTDVEDKMSVAQLVFDARTAPGEALDWLAGWFGVALDPAWTESRRRLFLRHAMDFFRMRGTVRGLQTALRLVIDQCADEQIFSDDASPRPRGIRLLEWFRLRETPALAFGDPSALSGIRSATAPPAWTPEQGGAALLQGYRAAASAAGLTTPIFAFPVFEPGDGTAPLWRRFLQTVLALSSTAPAADPRPWHDFLVARYPTVEAFNAAWGLKVTDLHDVDLPSSLPPDGAPLFDWYQFQLGGGRFAGSRTRWIPSQGGAALSDRWRQALRAAGVADASGDFPPVAPTGDAAAVWSSFATDVLGFVPSAGARVQQAWRDFLARRYRRAAALGQAYGATFTGFDDRALQLPAALPPDGEQLRDWYQFFSLAVASGNLAHRFTVLLPVPAREAFAVTLHRARRDLARRIVELEKPAHTLFDVKFYWAMFRIGEARVGADTLLDMGSRAPELMPPMVLDQGFLAESRLAATPPERETERPILGQDPLQIRNIEEARS